jgi:hypothetical protein
MHGETVKELGVFSHISNSVSNQSRGVCFHITDLTTTLWKANLMSATYSTLSSRKWTNTCSKGLGFARSSVDSRCIPPTKDYSEIFKTDTSTAADHNTSY